MDLAVLKAMCNRLAWSKLRQYVPVERFGRDTVLLLMWIDKYWSQYTTDEDVVFSKFNTLVACKGSSVSPEQLSIMENILKRLEAVPDVEVSSTLTMLVETAYAGELQLLSSKYDNGEEVDLVAESRLLHRKYNELLTTHDTLTHWVRPDINEILADNDEHIGLKLDFCGFADTVQGLKGGDNIGIAAPVDAGKTSFIARMVASFMHQMDGDRDRYGERPILWVVNEGVASRCYPRVYSAATSANLKTIREMGANGTLVPALDKYLGTDWQDRLRIINGHGMTVDQLATLIEEWQPVVAVTDMTANLRGGRADTETQNLEYVWQTIREVISANDCIHVGTIQLSAEGYDMLYPPLTALKQSKVGVQGALDICIMLGRLDQNKHPDYSDRRGISTPKNKRAISGANSLNQSELIFDSATCQFYSGAQDSSNIPSVN